MGPFWKAFFGGFFGKLLAGALIAAGVFSFYEPALLWVSHLTGESIATMALRILFLAMGVAGLALMVWPRVGAYFAERERERNRGQISFSWVDSAIQIDKLQAHASLRLTNDSGALLEQCLVKLDEFNGGLSGTGLPDPLNLRTENQIRENRNKPFELRPGEPKALPLLWAEPLGDQIALVGADGSRYALGGKWWRFRISVFTKSTRPSVAFVEVDFDPAGRLDARLWREGEPKKVQPFSSHWSTDPNEGLKLPIRIELGTKPRKPG